MVYERFMVDDASTLIDKETRNTYDYVSDVCELLNELHEENKQYKKYSISLKQLYKILEENKEHFLSLSECFAEKLLIKTIFRNIDEDIESMEEEE